MRHRSAWTRFIECPIDASRELDVPPREAGHALLFWSITKPPRHWHTACIKHGHVENTGTDPRSRGPGTAVAERAGLDQALSLERGPARAQPRQGAGGRRGEFR